VWEDDAAQQHLATVPPPFSTAIHQMNVGSQFHLSFVPPLFFPEKNLWG